jgi:hypothetical protein
MLLSPKQIEKILKIIDSEISLITTFKTVSWKDHFEWMHGDGSFYEGLFRRQRRALRETLCSKEFYESVTNFVKVDIHPFVLFAIKFYITGEMNESEKLLEKVEVAMLSLTDDENMECC